MKQLIINADDLGCDESRNEGIFEAIHAGTVTSVSVLVNGSGFQDAAERYAMIRGREVSLGIHINLSEGRPLSEDLRLLTDSDGCFLGKTGAHRLLKEDSSAELKAEIRREIKAQIAALSPFKARITHLDGHQHVHVAPAVLPIVLEEAREHHISWIRIPDEPHPSFTSLLVQNDPDEEAAMFSRLGAEARSFATLSGVDSCDHFRGLYLKGKLDMTTLEELLRNLPVGITELMVHPGRVPQDLKKGPFSLFSTIDRERELKALLDPLLPRLLEKYGIRLTHFPESLA